MQWAPAPGTIAGCPQGLEYLSQIDHVVIKQQVDLIEGRILVLYCFIHVISKLCGIFIVIMVSVNSSLHNLFLPAFSANTATKYLDIFFIYLLICHTVRFSFRLSRHQPHVWRLCLYLNDFVTRWGAAVSFSELVYNFLLNYSKTTRSEGR